MRRRGVLHRDIKPSNLFLRDNSVEHVTVLDFGIARNVLGERAMTRTGLIVGTPDYMAPEQARGTREVSLSADVYSLGCVLFECLTGRPPHVAQHVAALIAKILFEDAPRLYTVRPELPAPLDALLERMLSKDPAQRPQDGAALLVELDALAAEIEGVADDAAPSAPRQSQPIVMAGAEQRLVSVILAEEPRLSDPARATVDLAEVELQQARESAVSAGLTQFGARMEWLPNGSFIGTISQHGNAHDQANQAARCALLVKDRWPAARVVLSTGRGLVHERGLVGEAIDRAAQILRSPRTDKALETERVLVDEVTARLIDLRFDVRDSDTGVSTLHAERSTIDETRTLLGRPTPCLGRERELTALESIMSESVGESIARAALVIAPAGMGKSRLRIEFLRRVGSQPTRPVVMVGRGDPMTAGSVYGLIGQAIRHLCGILDGESLFDRQAKLRARVGRAVTGTESERVAQFLGELCGVPFPEDVRLRAARQDPRIMSDQVMLALLDFLRGECTRGPVLIVLEDLHWGDALTVKLVDIALRELADLPLMVLAFARPEVDELFPKLWSERGLQEIRLTGLGRKAAERLVMQALQSRISPASAARLVEQAAGNALFLEELIRAAADGKGEELPETVLAMLQARLTRLDPAARRVLRAASVFGERFWRGGVVMLLGQERTTGTLGIWLQALIDAEIIEQQRTCRFLGEVEYGFRHALIREAAYSMLTDDDRRIGHRLAGSFLEHIGETNPLLLAEHFQRGGDVERAAAFYARSAEHAFDGNDLHGAVQQAKRGIACGAQGENLGALQSVLASAYSFLGDMRTAFDSGKIALGLLTTGGQSWCKACGMMFLSAAVIGEHEALMELSQVFGATDPRPEARAAYVEAASVVLVMFGLIGLRAQASFFLSRVQKVGEPTFATDPAVRAWVTYGHSRFINSLEPKPFLEKEIIRESVDAFEKVGDRRMHAVACGDYGMALLQLLDLTGAEAIFRRGLELARRAQEPMAILWNEMYLALLLCEHGSDAELDQIPALAASVIATAGLGSVYGGTVSSALSAMHRRRGDAAAAEREARRGLESLKVMPTMSPPGWVALIRALVAGGRLAEACEVAEQARILIEAVGGCGAGEIAMRHAQVDALRAAAGESADTSPAVRAATRELLAQLDTRAADIPDPEIRARYLAQIPASFRAVARGAD